MPAAEWKNGTLLGTIDRSRDGECNEDLIRRIITHYNTKWVHKTLLMTPERAGEVKTVGNPRLPRSSLQKRGICVAKHEPIKKFFSDVRFIGYLRFQIV
jgi:hypothetical protein